MKKFDNRIELFKEILLEVYKHEVHYKEEINNLNIKLQNIITFHSNKFLSEVPSKSRSKYSDENPFIDKLISNDVQQLLAYFLKKYNIISKEVEEIEHCIRGSLNQKSKSENLNILIKEQKKFESNLKILKNSKSKYDLKMSKLEMLIYNNELLKNNDLKKNHEVKDKKINCYIPNSVIEEVISAKENYMLAIDTINLNKREFNNIANVLNTEINKYNLNENNTLIQVFSIFQKYSEILLSNIKDFSFLYGSNSKIQDEETVSFDMKMHKNYFFEEYIPQHKNINEKTDLLILIEMSKNTGFKIEEAFTDNKNKKEIKYLLLIQKLMENCESIGKSEIESLKEILSEKEYYIKFVDLLNKERSKNDRFNSKISFDIITDIFNYIMKKILLEKEHNCFKSLMILSQTYYMEVNGIKTYISSKVNSPAEFKNEDFWRKYLDIEITNNISNSKLQNDNEEAFITFVSNLPILNDFLSDHSKISSITKIFKEKYLFTEEHLNKISENLGFNVEI